MLKPAYFLVKHKKIKLSKISVKLFPFVSVNELLLHEANYLFIISLWVCTLIQKLPPKGCNQGMTDKCLFNIDK